MTFELPGIFEKKPFLFLSIIMPFIDVILDLMGAGIVSHTSFHSMFLFLKATLLIYWINSVSLKTGLYKYNFTIIIFMICFVVQCKVCYTGYGQNVKIWILFGILLMTIVTLVVNCNLVVRILQVCDFMLLPTCYI